ncbi:uncharacterized protein LOC144114614 isoform X2 [Amblyomma americanum]
MEKREQGSSPTKPRNPFKRKIWFEASVDKNQQVSVEMKKKCRDLLLRAIGNVLKSYPAASAETKVLLHDTFENIMKGLNKAFQLRVLDPSKLEKCEQHYESLLQQTKRKRVEMEQCNDRGRKLYEVLRHQYGPENGQESSSSSSTVFVEASDDTNDEW